MDRVSASALLPQAIHVVFALALLLVAGSLQGCESEFERATRLSCHWNDDITIRGCGWWSFSRCISHCEYCVTKDYGTSDDCNQLKCASFCAKQEDDSTCSENYETMCGWGKANLVTKGVACDVDCSHATGAARPTLLALIVTAVAALRVCSLEAPAGLRPSTFLLIIALSAVTLSLQGCGAVCPSYKPQFDWVPSMDELNKMAGCNNEWNWQTGNSCASGLSAPGTYKTEDEQWVKDQVENESYECLEKGKNGKYCQRWSAKEVSCSEQDFGECVCSEPAENGKYCASWTCLSKEADQHLCWEGCCGKDCDPCVVCGEHNSSPFEMNDAVYKELLNIEGMGSLMETDRMRALANAQKKHWSLMRWTDNTCIANQDIRTLARAKCDTWREIETEISWCACDNTDPNAEHCEQWHCEEKDVGLFSVLFSAEKSYRDLIEGSEIESYKCAPGKSITTADGTKCTEWEGRIESLEEVELTRCRGCEDETTPHCDSWKCDEYEVPRLLPYYTSFGHRLGMAILHTGWMQFVLFVSCAFFECTPEAGKAKQVVCVLPQIIFALGLIYCIGWLRYSQDADRWFTPTQPFPWLGVFAAVWMFGACVGGICCNDGDKENAAIMGFLFAVLFLWIGNFSWTLGLAGVGILFVPLCCCCCCVMGATASESKKEESGEVGLLEKTTRALQLRPMAEEESDEAELLSPSEED